MEKPGKPAGESTDTGDQLYPLVFRISKWHYVIAAITVAMSVFFMMLGYSRDGIAAIMLRTVGGLFLTLSIYYILVVRNAFVELDPDKMRYRHIRRIIELDLDQIYVEKINGAFLVHSPQHPQKLTVSAYYKDSTLLHSLLYKHSEQNTERLNEAAPQDIKGFSSFAEDPVVRNWPKRRLNYAVIFLLFVTAISIVL